MSCSRSPGFVATTLTTALLSAGLVFIAFGSGTSDAELRARRHAAVSEKVAIDGELVHEGEGWLVKVKVQSADAAAQDCTIQAAVTRTRGSPMSRVMLPPKVLWESTMAVRVPAKGRSDKDLAVPADVAKDLAVTPKPSTRVDAFGEVQTLGLRFDAKCQPQAEKVT